ncbi:MAG: hypothetical protein ACO33A_00180 [Hyphomonas sp.]
MVLALATSLVSLACQGCISSGSAGYAYVEPAAEPSPGMMLAVPGKIGNGALNAPSANSLAQTGLSGPLPEGDSLRLSQPDADIVILSTSPAPSAFSLTGSAPAGALLAGTGFSWTGSVALDSLAARIATGSYGQPDPEYRDVSFGLAVSATSGRTGLGFDVGLAPRVAIREGSELKTRSFGGELRLGQGLGGVDWPGQPEGWYVFVGADGEALVWDADRDNLGLSSFSDMQITDQLTVGDLQAGISLQRAGGELSFSYIRREIQFSDRNRSLSDSEDFAGVTFTMRR